MILKMQKSIASFPDDNEVILLTNANNTFECLTPIHMEAQKLLKGRNVAYFETAVINHQVIIRNEVPPQGW